MKNSLGPFLRSTEYTYTIYFLNQSSRFRGVFLLLQRSFHLKQTDALKKLRVNFFESSDFPTLQILIDRGGSNSKGKEFNGFYPSQKIHASIEVFTTKTKNLLSGLKPKIIQKA